VFKNASFSSDDVDHCDREADREEAVRARAERSEESARSERRARRTVGRKGDEAGRKLYVFPRLSCVRAYLSAPQSPLTPGTQSRVSGSSRRSRRFLRLS
jgi:hypothetical protein